MSSIAGAIARHFTDTRFRCSEYDKKNKSIIFGLGNFRRIVLFPAVSIFQMCGGSYYGWSVLSKGLQKFSKPNFNKQNLDLAFYVCVAFFGVTSCISGPWLERTGPRRPALIGASLFLLGNIVSAIGVHFEIIWLLIIGFGVLTAIGIGMSYVAPIAALTKFYSEKRGLASGVGVGTFGVGTIIASQFYQLLVQKELDPYLWFLIPGLLYFVLQVFTGLILRFPVPADEIAATEAGRSANVSQDRGKNLMGAVKTPLFFLAYGLTFTAVLPGLFFVGRIAGLTEMVFKPESPGMGSKVLGFASGANVGGRIIAGVLSDKFGRIPLLYATVIMQGGTLGWLFVALGQDGTLTQWAIAASILIFAYGAVFGLIPGLLGDCFGTGMVGALYGIALTSWSAAGLVAGPGMGGLVPEDKKGAYSTVLWILSAITIAGVIMLSAIFVLRRKASVPRA